MNAFANKVVGAERAAFVELVMQVMLSAAANGEAWEATFIRLHSIRDRGWMNELPGDSGKVLGLYQPSGRTKYSFNMLFSSAIRDVCKRLELPEAAAKQVIHGVRVVGSELTRLRNLQKKVE